MRHKQLYLPDSAVLLTRFLTEEGVAELIDFMPVREQEDEFALYRQLKSIRGRHSFTMHCKPRFGYARHAARIERVNGGYTMTDPAGEQPVLLLETDRELHVEDGELVSEIELREGETATFIFSLRDIGGDVSDFDQSLRHTHRWWNRWVSQTTYRGRWREMVNRSAITLKLMTSCLYGSTVAAVTFGLPEHIGGTRNWDYRFTWIRDAAFQMYAFLRLGFVDEAEHFMEWIRKHCLENLQLLYAVDGSTDLEERELEHLEGYRGSRPVRIGNAAAIQNQMDIYGELVDTIYLYNQAGGSITFEFWQRIRGLVEYVIEHWQQPDHGIWEVRNEERQFLHSRTCCWVAIDRAIKISEARSLPADLDRWRKVRDEIYIDIYDNFWNEELQAYVQYKGADVLDASALLMPLLRFVSSKEPRWLLTFERIEKELALDVLVYRYRQEIDELDGIEGGEGAFVICSFWYVECLARTGRLDDAILAFEKLLGYANHLGLYAEQVGMHGEQLGNFPQAFSHLSLISAAYQIDKKIGEA